MKDWGGCWSGPGRVGRTKVVERGRNGKTDVAETKGKMVGAGDGARGRARGGGGGGRGSWPGAGTIGGGGRGAGAETTG